MSNVVAQRISLLREAMKQSGFDWYFCTSDDFHASEYVADYFKVREFFTGFTGENAFLLLNMTEAYMWTDGRFFLQADSELSETGVSLMKMGEEGVPTVTEFLESNLKENETLIFDGRMVSTSWGKKLDALAASKKASIVSDVDITTDIWTDRPDLPSNPVTVYSDESQVMGESVNSKLDRIREELKKQNADMTFIGSLDDIAWITNMRGLDVECNPVFLSYMLITDKDAVIFMQKSETDDNVICHLNRNGIRIEDYNCVLEYLKTYDFKKSVLLDEGSVNYSCYKAIAEKTAIINSINPSRRMKAIKTASEIERLKEAYLLDSVCVTKFCYWLKNAVKDGNVTEMSAAEYIDNLRRQVPGFIELSFPTISGYGPNGAIVHYGVTEESNTKVKPEGMLLVDSGGQYEKGTTDVTRTVACGPVTDKMRLYYTKVAVGMLSLANAKFMDGCTGRNLDIVARMPLWEIGADYNHGTGHGIGYILNVHEGPQNIRWRYAEATKEYKFEPGMITSDEPGVYITGEFGIRIENVILCVEHIVSEFGKTLGFEHLTFAPLDRALLDKNQLNEVEIGLVNDYQEMVYNKMKGYLSKEEDDWLFAETRPL